MPGDTGEPKSSKPARASNACPWSKKAASSGLIWAKATTGISRSIASSPRTAIFAFGYICTAALKSVSIRRMRRSCIASSGRGFVHRLRPQFRGASALRHADDEILREYDNPSSMSSTPNTDALIALREIDAQRTHVRVTSQLFRTPRDSDEHGDDDHAVACAVDDRTATGTDLTSLRRRSTKRCEQQLRTYELPDYKSRRTRPTITASIRTSRRPRPIPAWATTSTSTTSGRGIDGRHQDCTNEHLGTSDKAIVQYRRSCGGDRKGRGRREAVHASTRRSLDQEARHDGRHRADPQLGNPGWKSTSNAAAARPGEPVPSGSRQDPAFVGGGVMVFSKRPPPLPACGEVGFAQSG